MGKNSMIATVVKYVMPCIAIPAMDALAVRSIDTKLHASPSCANRLAASGTDHSPDRSLLAGKVQQSGSVDCAVMYYAMLEMQQARAKIREFSQLVHKTIQSQLVCIGKIGYWILDRNMLCDIRFMYKERLLASYEQHFNYARLLAIELLGVPLPLEEAPLEEAKEREALLCEEIYRMEDVGMALQSCYMERFVWNLDMVYEAYLVKRKMETIQSNLKALSEDMDSLMVKYNMAVWKLQQRVPIDVERNMEMRAVGEELCDVIDDCKDGIDLANKDNMEFCQSLQKVVVQASMTRGCQCLREAVSLPKYDVLRRYDDVFSKLFCDSLREYSQHNVQDVCACLLALHQDRIKECEGLQEKTQYDSDLLQCKQAVEIHEAKWDSSTMV